MRPHEAAEILAAIDASRAATALEAFVEAAVRYARLRVDWYRSPPDARRSLDDARRRAHDAFIDTCNILSRAMKDLDEDNGWRGTLGSDRRRIGDLACYVHCHLALRAR